MRRNLLLALLLLTAPLFFVSGPEYTDAPLYRSLWNAGHLLFFIGVGVLCTAWLGKNLRRWLLASGILLLLSFGVEIIQYQIGREFSLQDIAHNLLGFWIGALWRLQATPCLWILRVSALAMASPLLWQVCQEARLHWLAHSQFPIIASFESELERRHLEGTTYLQQHHFSHGRSALAVQLTQQRYSGISVDRLLGDWRGYSTFALDIYNPDASVLAMTLRIADRAHNQLYHDRFNHQLQIQPGWNHITIPLAHIANAPAGRQLDLQHLTDITLFSVNTPSPRTIFVDHLRLE